MITSLDLPQLANTAFYSYMRRLIDGDKILRNSVKRITLTGTELSIESIPGKHLFIQKKLFRIVRYTWLSGAQCTSVRVNDRVFEWEFLTQTAQPAITNNPDGSYDRRLRVSILQQRAERYNALLEAETLDATVFIIDTSGVYIDAKMQRGITSKIPPESMIGKSLVDVLPCTATADMILKEMREAYALGQSRVIEYGLWDRKYKSKIVPFQGENLVAVICKRTQ